MKNLIFKSIGKFSQVKNSQYFVQLENQYGCHNYHPLPIVISKGKGIYVWDQEGKKYMDFLAAYSAVNQGHCHEKIYQELIQQASQLTLTSRAFYNNKLGEAEKYITQLFKYDKVLFMNSGVEAGESAIKFARRWAYNIKKVPENEARVLFANGNFWGRTIAACGSSDDPERYNKFGPFGGLNFDLVDYNNVDAIESKFKANPNYAAIFFEAIQGENGVIIPDQNYLKQVRSLCNKYNVLMIVDEIQTGLGRTGKMLAVEHDNVRPDMVLLGKALSGGFYPISAVLADDQIMLQIKPGEHGSTYGGNPLAASLCIKALEVLQEEKMIENAYSLGKVMEKRLVQLKKYNNVTQIRSRGLMGAIQFQDGKGDVAWDFCLKLAKEGLLCKPTHKTIMRLTPPLIINEAELNSAFDTIEKVLQSL
ncbi:unnamed protein product [Paramecium pentaurelia]|uniref:Ornithine aminotransferase n=1 Tax=Paramecium pentaurelia TaxID=43138 RepID=A0A8S1WN20_9CILI|nr:unnamed protein product [Paramecium pentaurelia]